MITYFIAGLLASVLMNYKELFATGPLSDFMKPVDSAWVAVGPAFQIIRGLIFSLALWSFRRIFLSENYGWLKLWGLIVGLAILSTAGPSPSSVEGIIYTVLPARNHLLGYLEILPQTLVFSLAVYYWYRQPKKLWNVLSIILVGIILLMSTLGFLSIILDLQVT